MDKQLSVKLPPSLTAETSVKIWEQVLGAESSGQTIFDASDLTFCDGVRFDTLIRAAVET